MGELVVIKNARIWTGIGDEATWMVFNKETGYIHSVGSGSPPQNLAAVSVKDLQGKRVVPGFHEAHIHVSDIGKTVMGLDLKECGSIEQFKVMLRDYADRNPDLEWIRAYNMDDAQTGRMPSKEDIDEVCPGRPVIVSRVCIHMGVANSDFLNKMGISSDMESPPGGVIEKYPKGHALEGQLTGALKENAYTHAMARIKVTSQERKRRITAGLQYCLEQGVTSVHSNEGGTWPEYCHLAEHDQLPIRVFYTPYFAKRQQGSFPEKPGASRGHLLSCDRTKLFTDGSLGADTAALSKPYQESETKENYGVQLYSQAEFTSLVAEALSLGYRLEVHAIGDAAADVVLEGLEKAGATPDQRHILTHCQILREDQLDRMQRLGMVANIQPQMLTSDSRWLDRKVHPDLLKFAYAWKSIWDRGIVCAGGSDAPVEEPKPLLGMYDAVFRPREYRNNPQQYRPDECLTIHQALELYTRGGAYATHREKDLGMLRPGYLADFVVLDGARDIIDHPEDLLKANIEEVWMHGQQKI